MIQQSQAETLKHSSLHPYRQFARLSIFIKAEIVTLHFLVEEKMEEEIDMTIKRLAVLIKKRQNIARLILDN